MKNLLLGMIIFTGGASGVVQALSYSAWASCITVANSSCTLDPNATPYTVSSFLTPANGVTMIGGGVSAFSTSLQRPSGTTGIMIYVGSGNSVTIENLTIDGNRYSFSNWQTGCDSNATGPTSGNPCGPVGGVGCTPANYGAVLDIKIDGTALIDNVQFWNSAGTAALYMRAGTVESSGFNYARSVGGWIFDGGTVHDSDFQYNGTAGLSMGNPSVISTTGTNSYNNTLYQNRWEMPDGSGGGQLYIGPSSTNNTAKNNFIDGNNWQTPAVTTTPPPSSQYINGCYPPAVASPQAVYGMEVEPGSGSNTVWGNEITRNTGSGITVNAVTSVSLSGYSDGVSSNPKYIHDNTGTNPPFGNYTNGIEILNASTGITLTGILSRSNDGYAVSFDTNSNTGTGWQNSHCLGSNFRSPVYTTSTGLSNPTPSSTSTCP